MHGGSCGGSKYNSITIKNGGLATNAVDTFGVYINSPVNGLYTSPLAYAVYNGTGGGTWNDYGSQVGGIWNDTGGNSHLFGTIIDGNNASTYDINLAGGTLRMTNTTTTANANVTG